MILTLIPLLSFREQTKLLLSKGFQRGEEGRRGGDGPCCYTAEPGFQEVVLSISQHEFFQCAILAQSFSQSPAPVSPTCSLVG